MGQTAVDIVLAVSEQWEFLPALALAIMAVWGRTRWSRAAVLAFCAAMAAAFTVAGVVTALNDWATRVLFMPLMTVMIPFYWRLSGLTFARSLFIASTCCVPMILCIDVTLAVDGLMPQYQHMSGFIALPGLTTQWILSLALIAACRRPMRALPRIVDSPVLSGRMWWVAWLLPFGAASVLSLFNATREEMLSRPDGTVLYTGLVVLIITMLALMYWLLWLVVVRSEHALVVVEENRTLAMRRMWSDHLNERIAASICWRSARSSVPATWPAWTGISTASTPPSVREAGSATATIPSRTRSSSTMPTRPTAWAPTRTWRRRSRRGSPWPTRT